MAYLQVVRCLLLTFESLGLNVITRTCAPAPFPRGKMWLYFRLNKSGLPIDNSTVFLCVQWVETHPQSQRMRLGDMQAKPHQRITKYPLLLKEVLQSTQEPQAQQTLRSMVRNTQGDAFHFGFSPTWLTMSGSSVVIQRQQFFGEHQRLPEAEGRRARVVHFCSKGGRVRSGRHQWGNRQGEPISLVMAANVGAKEAP